jgi:hypothetical protein
MFTVSDGAHASDVFLFFVEGGARGAAESIGEYYYVGSVEGLSET